MTLPPRLLRIVPAILATVLVTERMSAQNARQVLAAPTELKKAIAVFRARRNITAQDTLLILKLEKMSPIAAMSVGAYFETKVANPTEAAGVLRVAARRKDLASVAVVMAATNPGAAQIAEALLAKRQPLQSDRVLAARLAAAAGKVQELNRQAGARERRKQGLLRAQSWEPAVKRLLNDRRSDVVELAIVAAAYLRLKGVRERILALDAKAPAAVRAAQLLYQAKLGMNVKADQVEAVFANPGAAAARAGKLSPALSNYEVRVPALCNACEALGELGRKEYVKHLHQSLKNTDLRVRMDAIRAIERIGALESVAVLLPLLKQSPWPVRVVLLSALGAIPSADAIEPLIDQLAKEKGRLRLDVNYALASIVGEQVAQNAFDWRQWWQANQGTFKVDPARTRDFRAKKRVSEMSTDPIGLFYDIDLQSDRVVFVLDASKSMNGPRIASLKKELNETLKNMKPHVQFNIVHFGGHVEAMRRDGLMKFQQVRLALAKVNNMQLTLGTRSYDAMVRGMQIPGADTIVFLSDGAPVAGQFDSWQRIMSAISYFNRYRPIAIYTLEFSAGGANLQQMKNLAIRNAGLSGKPQE